MRLSLLLFFLFASGALAENSRKFGASQAPAFLGAGQTAMYGFLGAPEVGVGYRQGIENLELQGQWTGDFFQVSTAIEGLAKYPVYDKELLKIAVGAGIGGVFHSGSTYLTKFTAQYVGIRPKALAVASYQLAETAFAVAQLDLPVTFSVRSESVWRTSPLLGGGVELYLSEGVSASALAQFGLDTLSVPNQPIQHQFNWQFRMGVGWRIF